MRQDSMPNIQHFEFPAGDVERARKFYKGIWMGKGEVGKS